MGTKKTNENDFTENVEIIDCVESSSEVESDNDEMAMELMVGFASEAYRHSSEVKKIPSPPGTQTLPSKISIVKKRKQDFPVAPTQQTLSSKLSIVKKRKQDFPLP